MKLRPSLALCAALIGFTALVASPPVAEARVVVGVGIGGGYYGGYRGGYYPYYDPYYYGYPAYYPPAYYVAPPPTVVYQQPPVTYVQPAPQDQQPIQLQPQAAQAGQAGATYTDKQGRTCRSIQSTIDGTPVNGTACQTSDGTWHTVD